MAATKASKKRSSSSKRKPDATKTPPKASKQSKAEHRRPAPTVGDTTGAEFNPARTEEGERVAQTGANPAASRAGVLVHLPSLVIASGGDPEALKTEVAVLDGSRAQLNIQGVTDQAGVLTVIKQLNEVVQQTY